MNETFFVKIMKADDEDNNVHELKYWLRVFYRGFEKLFCEYCLNKENRYKCPECGSSMEWNKTVGESNPPQFDYECKQCGHIKILDSAKHEILEELKLKS